MVDDALSPGDMVALKYEDDCLPVFNAGDESVNALYGDEVALVLCVSVPPTDGLGPGALPCPLLLLVSGPMGWAHDPHLLVRL